MSKRSVVSLTACAAFAGVAALAIFARAQNPPASGPSRGTGLPPGAIQEKAREACLGCHTAAIIVQQQLEKRVWVKEVDKMIRWGAPVAPGDREAMIDYFAENFGPRGDGPADAPLARGPGVEKVRAACLSCHGAVMITAQQMERRGWARVVDQMTRWGAKVRPGDREAILDYLAAHYGPPAKETKKDDKPQ